jgi:hypothetical protein
MGILKAIHTFSELLDNVTLSENKPEAIGKLYNVYHGCINASK